MSILIFKMLTGSFKVETRGNCYSKLNNNEAICQSIICWELDQPLMQMHARMCKHISHTPQALLCLPIPFLPFYT